MSMKFPIHFEMIFELQWYHLKGCYLPGVMNEALCKNLADGESLNRVQVLELGS